MNNLNDKEIYVVFDANSGKVVSIHVVGLSTRIPTEAIRVTGEQYARLIEDSNWVYDWDTEKLVYKPVDKSLNLEELREACRNKINAAVSAEIANGFVLKLHGQQVRFSCSDTDQRNITHNKSPFSIMVLNSISLICTIHIEIGIFPIFSKQSTFILYFTLKSTILQLIISSNIHSQ